MTDEDAWGIVPSKLLFCPPMRLLRHRWAISLGVVDIGLAIEFLLVADRGKRRLAGALALGGGGLHGPEAEQKKKQRGPEVSHTVEYNGCHAAKRSIGWGSGILEGSACD